MKPPHACTGEELSEEGEWGGAERWRIMWPLSVFDTICCGLIRSACSDTGGVLKTLLLFFFSFFLSKCSSMQSRGSSFSPPAADPCQPAAPSGKLITSFSR